MQQEKEKAVFLDKDGNIKIMVKFAKEDEQLHPDITEDITKIQEEQEDGANSVKIMEDEAELELKEQLKELLEEQLEDDIMDEIMKIMEDKDEPNEDIFKVLRPDVTKNITKIQQKQ